MIGDDKLNGLTIDENTFEGLSIELQLKAIYQNVEESRSDIKLIKTQLIKRRKFDTGIAAASGLFGGMLAMIGKWTIFKG